MAAEAPPQLGSHTQLPHVASDGLLSHNVPTGQAPPQVVSHWHDPDDALQVSLDLQAPQQLGSAAHKPLLASHTVQAMGSQVGVDSQLAQRQIGPLLLRALHAASLVPLRHSMLQVPPQVGSTAHKPQEPELGSLLQS